MKLGNEVDSTGLTQLVLNRDGLDLDAESLEFANRGRCDFRPGIARMTKAAADFAADALPTRADDS